MSQAIATLGRTKIDNTGNHLIELLPRKARLGLLADCEPVELVLSEVLSEPGEPIRHVYFRPLDLSRW